MTPRERTVPRPTPVAYGLTIRNSGKTPAYDVEVHATTMLGPRDLDVPLVDPRPPGPNPSRTILPPGASAYQTLKPHLVPPEMLADLIEGTLALYIVGWVEYRDAFKKKRWSKFQYIVPRDNDRTQSCKHGNKADQSEDGVRPNCVQAQRSLTLLT